MKYSVVSPKNPEKTVNNGIKTIKDINVEIIKYRFIDKTFFFIAVTKLFYFQPASIIIFNAVDCHFPYEETLVVVSCLKFSPISMII